MKMILLLPQDEYDYKYLDMKDSEIYCLKREINISNQAITKYQRHEAYRRETTKQSKILGLQFLPKTQKRNITHLKNNIQNYKRKINQMWEYKFQFYKIKC